MTDSHPPSLGDEGWMRLRRVKGTGHKLIRGIYELHERRKRNRKSKSSLDWTQVKKVNANYTSTLLLSSFLA